MCALCFCFTNAERKMQKLRLRNQFLRLHTACRITKACLLCVCSQVTSPPEWNRKCRLWAAMGQRAALLLSELLLLLLTASRTLLAVSFPEDTVPLDVVDAHCEYTHAHMNSAATGWRGATSLKKVNSYPEHTLFSHSGHMWNEGGHRPVAFSSRVSSSDTSMPYPW